MRCGLLLIKIEAIIWAQSQIVTDFHAMGDQYLQGKSENQDNP
jgi:hypothetical protein